jgi:hypothetical protein
MVKLPTWLTLEVFTPKIQGCSLRRPIAESFPPKWAMLQEVRKEHLAYYQPLALLSIISLQWSGRAESYHGALKHPIVLSARPPRAACIVRPYASL